MTKPGLIFTLAALIIVGASATAHAQDCGDGVVETGEYCDDQFGTGGYQFAGNMNCTNGVFDYGTLSCDGSCELDFSGCWRVGEGPAQLCGNGVFEAGEECDGQAYCSGDCKCDQGASLCGDGTVDCTEACDDGTLNSDNLADACRTNCQLYHCGDGVTDTGEDCDEGTGNSDTLPDTCRTDCSAPGCGDGVVDVLESEECDNGVANSDAPGADCSVICLVPRCGNGYMDGDELCDDGNTTGGDGCSADCQSLEECGNDIVDQAAGETCDDGNLVDDDGCSADCLIEGCGDGVISGFEECDDGNLLYDDGCSPLCAVETGWTCEGEPSACSADDTDPVDTDPVDTDPVDTDPVDTDPVDTDPSGENPDDDGSAQDTFSEGSCSTLGAVGGGGASVTWLQLLALIPLI